MSRELALMSSISGSQMKHGFPATLGTEFRIRAAFVINRRVSVSMENSAFEHAHVVSRMKVIGEVECEATAYHFQNSP